MGNLSSIDLMSLAWTLPKRFAITFPFHPRSATEAVPFLAGGDRMLVDGLGKFARAAGAAAIQQHHSVYVRRCSPWGGAVELGVRRGDPDHRQAGEERQAETETPGP